MAPTAKKATAMDVCFIAILVMIDRWWRGGYEDTIGRADDLGGSVNAKKQ